MQALETVALSKRYDSTWALRDCNLQLPTGRIAGLVGPNGAGKTTLLHLAMGLLTPTSGSIRVLGQSPTQQQADLLPRVGIVAQDRPLYRSFLVQGMLTFGRKLNPNWDDDMAHKRLERLKIPLKRQVGQLSGGQQAQVALVMALAKRPELVLLDEPVANLDPLARREFQQTLMDVVAQNGLTVLLSSHLVADLDRICDYMIILSASRVQVASDIDELLQSHKWLIGPREHAQDIIRSYTVIEESHSERQSRLLVNSQRPIQEPIWQIKDTSLEDIVLAYLAQPDEGLSPSDQHRQEVSL